MSDRVSNDDQCDHVLLEWDKMIHTWTIPLIYSLDMIKPSRFNELKRRIGGICSTSLSERLLELEKEKIVKRIVSADSPPRVEYYLTEKGNDLKLIIKQVAEWINKWK
ncbi:MAG: helix-turn-helix transcriptional regulator [Nitrososphaerota archaeon]|nr:helix-turn-helix transcriptional regulator [Nitrososphaerota archaeon]